MRSINKTKDELLQEIEELKYKLKLDDKVVSDQNFKNFFNGLNDAVFMHPLEPAGFGKFIEVNDAACEMYGYKREELLKLTPNDINLADNRKDRTFKIKQDLISIRRVFLESVHKTKTGIQIPVELNSRIIEFNGREVILSVVHNLTIRKTAQEALLESNAKNISLLNALPDIMFIFDSEGTYLDIFTENEKKLMQPSDKLLGKKISEVISQEFAEIFTGYIQKALETRKLQIYEYKLSLKGETHFFEARIVPYLKDKVLSLVRDITDRKLSERSLLDSEERYRDLVEKSDIAIIIDDKEGNFTYSNETFSKLFGYSAAEIKKESIRTLVHKDDIERVMKIHRDRMTGKNVHTKYEFKGVRKDGAIIFIEVAAVELWENGNVVGTRSYFWDITDRKQIELKLKQNEDMLRQIIDTAPNSIFVKDREGKYLVVNKRMAEFHNTTPDQLVGKYDHQIASKWFESIHYNEFRKQEQKLTDSNEKLLINEELFRFNNGRELWFQTQKIPFNMEGDHKCLLVISTDITEIIKSRNILRKSEEKYRTLTENLNVGVYRNTPGERGRFIEVNQAFLKIFGYTDKQEILNLNVSDLYLNPEDRERLSNEMLKKGSLLNREVLLKKKDGTSIVCSVTATAVKHDGKIDCFDGIVEDISENKRVENIQKALSKITNTLNTSTDMDYIYVNIKEILSEIINTDNFYIAIYNETEDLLEFHYHKDEKVIFKTYPAHKTLSKYVITTGKSLFGDENTLNKLIEDGVVGKAEGDTAAKIWVGVPLKYHNKVLGVIAVQSYSNADKYTKKDLEVLELMSDSIAIGIEHKKAEEEMQKLAAVVKYSSELVNMSTLDGRMIFLNESGCKMLGIEAQEVKNVNIMEVIPDHLKGLVEKELLPALMSVGFWEGDLQYRNIKTGGLTDVHATTFTVIDPDSGEPQFLANVSLDISERNKTVKALQSSEERFKNLFESAPDAIYLYDKFGTFIDGNKAAEEVIGYKKEDLIGKNFMKLKLLSPASIIKASKLLAQNIKGKGTGPDELTLNRIDGSKITIEIRTYPVKISNKTVFMGIARDISERKRIEERILKLSTAVEQSPSVIVITDLNGNIEYVNPKFTNITGYSYKDVLGENPRIMKSGEQPDKLYRDLWKTIKSGKEWHGEFHNKKKNGQLFWETASISSITDKHGKVINYIKVAEDITLQKEAEEKLQESEMRFKTAGKAAYDLIYEWDSKNDALEWFGDVDNMLGYEQGTISRNVQAWLALIHKDDIKVMENAVEEHRTSTQPINYEYRIKHKDGTYKYWSDHALPLLDNTGLPYKWIGVCTDISQQKRMESVKTTMYNISNAVNSTENLNELYVKVREYLGSVIDVSNFYVALYDEERNKISFGYYADETFDQKNQIPTSREFSKGLTEYIISTGKPLLASREIQNELTRTGKIDVLGTIPEIWIGVPLKIENKVIGLIALQSYDNPDLYSESDIEILSFISDEIALAIERKRSEEMIKKNLVEKETLLRELYHRTKNNMQVISAMLSMQSHQSESDYVTRSFKEIIGKINAMSLVHEKLYRSKDLSRINLKDYLTDLTDLIIKSLGTQANNVKTQFDLEEVHVAIDSAVPLGLVINELITNIFKHAFADSKKGILFIKLAKDTDGLIHLAIGDNGAGIPEDLDLRKSRSMGLQTVFTLIEYQIKGEVKYFNDNGLKWLIQFKDDVHRKRL